MKTKIYYFVVLMIVMSSCTSLYYQFYKTAPIGDIIKVDNKLVFENDDCRVIYDFWSEGGNVGFTFLNKTDEIIQIKLDKCFFVLNGFANDYFKNREFTYSSTTSLLNSSTNSSTTSTAIVNSAALGQITSISKTSNRLSSSGHSVTTHEEKDVFIPPHSVKYISEYIINNSLYRDCDMSLTPTKKQKIPIKFSLENSPYIFRNLITYSLGESADSKKVDNGFYVQEISNCPESEAFKLEYETICGHETMKQIKVFKIASPDMFYVKYNMDNEIDYYSANKKSDKVESKIPLDSLANKDNSVMIKNVKRKSDKSIFGNVKQDTIAKSRLSEQLLEDEKINETMKIENDKLDSIQKEKDKVYYNIFIKKYKVGDKYVFYYSNSNKPSKGTITAIDFEFVTIKPLYDENLVRMRIKDLFDELLEK